MIEAGLWEPKPRRHRHGKRRERRSAFEEMVLMDTSMHSWIEDRSDEEIVLIALIDDATSRLCCRFFSRDTGAANRQFLNPAYPPAGSPTPTSTPEPWARRHLRP
jgi:hypothetical protein